MSEPLEPFLDGRARHATFSVRPIPPATLSEQAGLLAGAAEVDLTPPPGMPKAGYSANAHDGDGFRTRLRARVLHLRTGTASLALVQCDLLGGSSVVQHLVAQKIAPLCDVPLAGLFIGATHTHAGPGQFLGTDFYNRFASNRSGFDPAYTQFLVDRIAGAVVRATHDRRPARLAVGSIDVWGWTRNRSQAPYVRNDTVVDKRTEPQRKYVSVNPELHLIRVDTVRDTGTQPLAAAVVFSVHGTGVPMRAHEYNADLWAYVTGELGDRIEAAHGTRPVVGAMEGTHADVAPAIRSGAPGHIEARRVGAGIGAAAAELYERLGDELTDVVPIQVGLREIELERSRTHDGVTLPRRPTVGAALVAGAHENLTPVISRIPPFRPGTPKRWGSDSPHGAKWVIGSRWLQPLVLPLRSFPRVLPVHVLRIGPATIVGLPFEITVETGRRVARAVSDATGGDTSVIVSSVANEYSGYIATAEEYALQHYEGGHTLYGPLSQRFLAGHAAELAATVRRVGTVAEVAAERRWKLKVRRYLARPTGRRVARVTLAAPRFSDPTRTVDGYWSFEWLDAAPGDLQWHEPLVRIEASDGGGPWSPLADDQGHAIEISHRGEVGDGHRYRLRWYEPAHRGGRRYRFVLLANGPQPQFTTEPFD